MFAIEREYRILIDVEKFAVYQTGWVFLHPPSSQCRREGAGQALALTLQTPPPPPPWLGGQGPRSVLSCLVLSHGTACQRSELPPHLSQIPGEEGKGGTLAQPVSSSILGD